MKKKKQFGVLFAICCIVIAGTLYTITYMKPWEEEVLLIDGKNPESFIQEVDSATTPVDEEIEELASVESPEAEVIFVHICGEVQTPGVYEVSFGTRLNAVVELAGGLTLEAAAEYTNLAQVVVDGQQYFIPSRADVEGKSRLDVLASFQKDTSSIGDPTSSLTTQSGIASGNININTATREELMTISGIGEAKADAIIEYRETVNRFDTIDDVMKVAGIKETLFHKIKDQIVVN